MNNIFELTSGSIMRESLKETYLEWAKSVWGESFATSSIEVICDSSNNSPQDIENRILNVSLIITPPPPPINITLTINPDGELLKGKT